MGRNAKRRNALCAVVLAGAFWGVGGIGPVPAHAQKPPADTSTARPSAVTGAAGLAEQDISIIDAQRGALDRFLDAHPEIEGDVEGNPVSMSDPNYLHQHPELQAFLESHPQVKADPRAFLSPADWRFRYNRSEIDTILGYFVPAGVFVCFLLAALWVVRTVVESRRWNRSFKMNEDLHAKLIEKFASGQDFSAYLQSEAGRRLLEWTPPAPDASRALPNAVGRILWSLQAGVVLFLVGSGLILIRTFTEPRAALPLMVFGTLGVTLGSGFIISAVISYRLSKHLGLIGGGVQGSELAMNR